ncbi:helix-turn-helix domain-containing protein [Neokomagataea anthophila]|uniref:Helix-turn-helix domain-containing protein n=1 Tax=Neokomagataea anthophila TaxID=2826925 RepID=A0ABS5E6K2_9PROT|nr:helix-turn-helix domain-containing protein [Neokomagataea anthophila]MBR0559532.1 helix-turn-helix domain-containing protein [Neokomagataea anthophila]
MARKPSGMHVEDIKASLRKKWGTLTALSRHLGRNPNVVTQALATPGYSVPVERAIAEELGRAPQDVWPDRFDHNGEPLSLRVERITSASISSDHRRNGVAA